jgi:hypothetical protein
MSSRFGLSLVLVHVLLLQSAATSHSQEATVSGKAEASRNQAMKEGKYTFLLFYKQNDEATKAMAATINQGLADKSDKAVAAYVQIGDATEQALIAKYDVSRAAMPMTVAVAPNGAMTGMFAQRLTVEKLNEAFVTPTMMTVMKNLQDGKLVLVTVQGSENALPPVAVKGFQNDPHFKDRLVSLGIAASDPLETKFLGQMQIDARSKVTQTVLIAPPGVLVGKFDALASKDDIAAALAKAGKCCDDPNCKHHQPAPRTATTQGRR